ncbi:Carboxysome polypeptide [Thiomonas arsenitoxydans]|uniref:Carboxysome polypeptide n=2 Tax=Thiomonas TaxID=32012 RepID=D6CQJ9_THIA3|nr:carboxysome polypeptide [Thiomonas intermedia K12]CAZ86890.1 carboxysome polypeptide [Thiomonas arsenitoxydans]CQR31888.1 Carboxysome polypeptide [Thiomonas arsenitoxydans]
MRFVQRSSDLSRLLGIPSSATQDGSSRLVLCCGIKETFCWPPVPVGQNIEIFVTFHR